jgi:hypothetical protein
LRLGNHDQRAIAARVRHQRKPDAGIAGGALHHQPAGFDLAALLGLQDHLAPRAILHRLPRIHELGFAEDRAAGLLGCAREPDQGRVADGFDDAVTNLHGRTRGWDAATLEDGPVGNKAR